MGRQLLMVLLVGLATACGNSGPGGDGNASPTQAPATVATDAPAQPADAGQGAFPEGSWDLSALLGEEVDISAGITMDVLADGKIAGSGGCNRYFGSMSLVDGQLVIGPLGATMMACEQAAMDLEHRFIGALEKVTGFVVEQDTLLLNDRGETTMVFVMRRAEATGE